MGDSENYDEKTIPLYEQVKINIFLNYQEALDLYKQCMYKRRDKDIIRFANTIKQLYLHIRPKIEQNNKIPILEAAIKDPTIKLNFKDSIDAFIKICDMLEEDLKITRITFETVKPTKAYNYNKK